MKRQSLVPEWVRAAILDKPTCELCGEAVLTEGRTVHVICTLIAEQESK